MSFKLTEMLVQFNGMKSVWTEEKILRSFKAFLLQERMSICNATVCLRNYIIQYQRKELNKRLTRKEGN